MKYNFKIKILRILYNLPFQQLVSLLIFRLFPL